MGVLTGDYRVLVAGTDVTSRWRPTLKELSVTKAAGKTADSFEGTLADPDGATVMPDAGAEVQVELGHVETGVGLVFIGTVSDVRSRGAKGSGREISVAASSADHRSKIKSPALRSAFEATFGDVAREWGGKVGLDVAVIGSLEGAFRPYWIQQHESFMAWGQRMARELGGTFRIIGKRAFFAPRNEGQAISGQALTPIVATWGENLLTWDVSPILSRPQYVAVKDRHYDLKTASWVEVTQAVKGATVDADLRPVSGKATPENANQSAGSSAKESERESGQGTVTIIGDYAAEPEAECRIVGARPGIDGTYRIDGVTHSLSKDDGFTTSLTLKQPGNGAGKDGRNRHYDLKTATWVDGPAPTWSPANP